MSVKTVGERGRYGLGRGGAGGRDRGASWAASLCVGWAFLAGAVWGCSENTAALEGTVRSATGDAPLVGARVVATTESDIVENARWLELETTTDEAGAFRIESALAGQRYRLTVSLDAYSSATAEVDLPALGETRRLESVSLTPLPTARLKIVHGLSGEAMAQCEVTVRGPEGQQLEGTSGADGVAVFERTPFGSLVIDVRCGAITASVVRQVESLDPVVDLEGVAVAPTLDAADDLWVIGGRDATPVRSVWRPSASVAAMVADRPVITRDLRRLPGYRDLNAHRVAGALAQLPPRVKAKRGASLLLRGTGGFRAVPLVEHAAMRFPCTYAGCSSDSGPRSMAAGVYAGLVAVRQRTERESPYPGRVIETRIMEGTFEAQDLHARALQLAGETYGVVPLALRPGRTYCLLPLGADELVARTPCPLMEVLP